MSREHNCDALAIRELYHQLFPGTGYAFESYGTASSLRDVTVDQVRDYHVKNYRPNNLTVFISGRVSSEAVLESLTEIEEKIIGKGAEPSDEKAWTTSIEPLSETIIETINYPSDEETNGTIMIGWRGPDCLSDYETLQACLVLLHYLCSSPISPLRRDLMEVDEPLVSHMDFQVIEHRYALILIKLSGIPMEKCGDIDSHLMSVIRGIANQDESFDMDRMRIIIQNYFYETELNEMERQPHLHVFRKVLPTIVYGNEETNDQELLEKRFNIDTLTNEMLAKSEEDWLELLKQYFVEVSFAHFNLFVSLIRFSINHFPLCFVFHFFFKSF